MITIIMVLITVITRFGGVVLMSWVPITPCIERFINYMASSVLIAIIAPMGLSGDTAAFVALSVTAIVMITIKIPLLAIGAGMLATVVVRNIGSF